MEQIKQESPTETIDSKGIKLWTEPDHVIERIRQEPPVETTDFKRVAAGAESYTSDKDFKVASLFRSQSSDLSANNREALLSTSEGSEAHVQDSEKIYKPGDTWDHWNDNEKRVLVSLRTIGKTWQEIAKSLPGRTAQGCADYWFTHLAHLKQWLRFNYFNSTHHPWSQDERDLMVSLRRARNTWKTIAANLPGRTVGSCRSFWWLHQREQALDSVPPRAERWSSEETDLLVRLRNDNKSFELIAQRLPKRNATQCFDRASKVKKDQKRNPQYAGPKLLHRSLGTRPDPMPRTYGCSATASSVHQRFVLLNVSW